MDGTFSRRVRTAVGVRVGVRMGVRMAVGLASLTLAAAGATARADHRSGAGSSSMRRSSTADSRDRGAALAAFARGVRAYRSGAYTEAEAAFASALADDPKSGASHARKPPLLNLDWITYLRAESAFYAGHIAAARSHFESLSRMKGSRFASVAAYRVGDCLWSEGEHVRAVELYRRLPAHPPPEIDPAVARFRVALLAEQQKRPEATRLFLAFYREFPAHPWSAEAQSRTGPLRQESPGRPPSGAIAPEVRLRRAETLSADRNWNEALAELALLPPELSAPLAVERDYQIGMTKFQMRRDYAGAAQLLLGTVPALRGDKAASALFHGTRALSRIDRDDEAIAGYKEVVARFPNSRFAPEAQFLSGWLDYNRGRYRESLPGLRATVERFGKSPFADDAAWCLAFAHYLRGELKEAALGLERYARLPPTGMTSDEQAARVAYWRARLSSKAGGAPGGASGTPERVRGLDPREEAYREISRRWPFTFYGVVARARLAEWGIRAPVDLPAPTSPAPAAPKGGAPSRSSAPVLAPALAARVDELAAAGLDVEAGWELERAEKTVPRGRGGPGAGSANSAAGIEPWLRRYGELENFHRAYQLAETRQGGALSRAPTSGGRIWWEAAYPRAYRELVDAYGPGSGNPELLLYAIMRKESGFSPWDVSTADARGLLQMIPPTSAQVSREAGLDFAPDELYDPAINIRLGAVYIGGLAKKFHQQIPLIAGAYNAGPKAMAKWCDQHGTHPVDEFVELIAFTQTREYAKRVVGIYARYRHLYGPSEYEQPLTVNPRYGAGGPDY